MLEIFVLLQYSTFSFIYKFSSIFYWFRFVRDNFQLFWVRRTVWHSFFRGEIKKNTKLPSHPTQKKNKNYVNLINFSKNFFFKSFKQCFSTSRKRRKKERERTIKNVIFCFLLSWMPQLTTIYLSSSFLWCLFMRA